MRQVLSPISLTPLIILQGRYHCPRCCLVMSLISKNQGWDSNPELPNGKASAPSLLPSCLIFRLFPSSSLKKSSALSCSTACQNDIPAARPISRWGVTFSRCIYPCVSHSLLTDSSSPSFLKMSLSHLQGKKEMLTFYFFLWLPWGTFNPHDLVAI